MPLPTGSVLGILADNLKLRKSVLPLSRTDATGWAKGLGVPRGGETVMYTGHMYQLMPPIVSMEKMLAAFEDSKITALFGMGHLMNKLLNLSWFMSWPDRKEQQAFNRRPRNIALLLEAAKVRFGYLYGDELYAGALIYDEGVDHVFESHARKVYDTLMTHGVKRVITIDPHTTNVLRSVYPEIIDGFKLEVQSYLEVLAERDMNLERRLDREVVIHDSCVYARHENVVEEPRILLKRAGAEVLEPEYSGKRTMCCGGPIESFFPSKTKALAEKRMGQLASCGDRIAAMCPICLVNLQHAAGNDAVVHDISDYLVEAFCPAPSGSTDVSA